MAPNDALHIFLQKSQSNPHAVINILENAQLDGLLDPMKNAEKKILVPGFKTSSSPCQFYAGPT
jgi:hypothetical protein